MSFWKVLGGALVGVGAVAAAPFTGGGSVLAGVSLLGSLASAGAVASAVGAGLIGAAAGAAISEAEKEEREREKSSAKEEGKKAGEFEAMKKMNAQMAPLIERLKTYEQLEQKFVGLYAVGLAISKRNGTVCSEDTEALDALIAGVLNSNFPQEIKNIVIRLRENPPSFEQAMLYAIKYNCSPEDIDIIIDVMTHIDGVDAKEKEAVITKWQTQMRPIMAGMA